jgi:hypothetical protein
MFGEEDKEMCDARLVNKDEPERFISRTRDFFSKKNSECSQSGRPFGKHTELFTTRPSPETCELLRKSE